MITVIHNKCGNPAFYFRERLTSGDIIQAENVVLVNGDNATPQQPIVCGSCHSPIGQLGPHTVTQVDQHWSDWFLLKEDKWRQNRLL